MAILYSYVAFRHHFAQVARTQAVSLTYNATSPPTITRGAGSFVSDGHLAGHTVSVIGTTNNGGRYTVGTVAALTLTLSADDSLTAEGPVTSSLVSAFYELDMMERWPTTLVRASGFDDGFTPSVTPFSPFPLTLTVNGGIADASAGTSYTWYLSQRTEDTSGQHLTITHADSTKTGTVTLALTAQAVADLGLASATSSLNAGQRIKLLTNVYVYCQRASDKAIQQVGLLGLSDAQPV